MLQISLLIMKNHKTEIAVFILPPKILTIQNLFNKNTCHLTSNWKVVILSRKYFINKNEYFL